MGPLGSMERTEDQVPSRCFAARGFAEHATRLLLLEKVPSVLTSGQEPPGGCRAQDTQLSFSVGGNASGGFWAVTVCERLDWLRQLQIFFSLPKRCTVVRHGSFLGLVHYCWLGKDFHAHATTFFCSVKQQMIKGNKAEQSGALH